MNLHWKPISLWLFAILLVSSIVNTPHYQEDDRLPTSTSSGPPLLSIGPGKGLSDVEGITVEEQEAIIARAVDEQWQHIPLGRHR